MQKISSARQKPAPILIDIANQHLATVSWVIPAGTIRTTPGVRPAWAGFPGFAAIVNAMGNSTYWSNTAIIVTSDDWADDTTTCRHRTLSLMGKLGIGLPVWRPHALDYDFSLRTAGVRVRWRFAPSMRP